MRFYHVHLELIGKLGGSHSILMTKYLQYGRYPNYMGSVLKWEHKPVCEDTYQLMEISANRHRDRNWELTKGGKTKQHILDYQDYVMFDSNYCPEKIGYKSNHNGDIKKTSTVCRLLLVFDIFITDCNISMPFHTHVFRMGF